MTIAATFGDLNRVYTDANFQPLASGTLTFLEAGTSTPRDVFSQPDLTGALANPYALNASGFADDQIYLQNAGYDVVLKDINGVVQAGWPRTFYGVAAPDF